MARLTPARSLLCSLALTALALAACTKSSNSPLPAGATPTPTVSPTVGPSSTPPASTAGLAFLPDAGNGGPSGVTVLHFEEFTGAPFPYAPQFGNFSAPVRYLAIDSSGTAALALLRTNSSGPPVYSMLQGVLGSAGAIFPGGAPYNTDVVPPSPAPTNAVISDVTDEEMIGTAADAVGLSLGPTALGILGVNQAAAQTPTFNGFIGFACKGRTATYPSGYLSVLASPAVGSQTGDYSVLVRGPHSLLSFSVAPNLGGLPPRYTFCFQKEDLSLGASMLAIPGVVGRGLMAFSPTDPTRAFLGQVTALDKVDVVTGLPFAITPLVALTLTGAGRVNSVAVTPSGQYAAVGTDAGLFVVSGISTASIAIVGQGPKKSMGPFSPLYKGANGHYQPVANVTSVGFSADGNFLAAMVSLYPNSPGGGKHGTMVVLPFDSGNGVLAAPAVVDNNLPLPAYYQDILTVR